MALGRKQTEPHGEAHPLLDGFTRQVIAALEERRRSLPTQEALQALMSGHAELQRGLLAEFQAPHFRDWAVDAVYDVTPTSAGSSEVIVTFDLQFVLVGSDRLVILRVNRNVQQSLVDDPDLVNQTLLALNSQPLRINQKAILPLRMARGIHVVYGDGLTPTLAAESLPEPLPLGSAEMAERVANALAAPAYTPRDFAEATAAALAPQDPPAAGGPSGTAA